MKITRVTFGRSVDVVRGQQKIEWEPGKDGVKAITWAGERLMFHMGENIVREVVPGPWTIVTEFGDIDEPAATSSARALPAPKARR